MLENGPKIHGAARTVAVGAGETGYSSPVWDLVDLSFFSLEYQVACTGSPNVKLQIQQSTDNSNWVTPDNTADIAASVTDTNLHLAHIAPVCARYLRIKVIEQTSIVTDTVVTLKLSVQKRFEA